jgi:hypothetical protein
MRPRPHSVEFGRVSLVLLRTLLASRARISSVFLIPLL